VSTEPVTPPTWFEERGLADAVLDVVFDGDRKGRFVKGFAPTGQWIPVALKPAASSPHPWDCRLVLDGIDAAPRVSYRLDGFFLSPDLARTALPVGSVLTVFSGAAVGHATLVEWL
jgi:hypothetical protein